MNTPDQRYIDHCMDAGFTEEEATKLWEACDGTQANPFLYATMIAALRVVPTIEEAMVRLPAIKLEAVDKKQKPEQGVLMVEGNWMTIITKNKILACLEGAVNMTKWLNEEPRSVWFFVEDASGMVLGVACVVNDDRKWYLEFGVWVRPENRKQGIGRRLCREVNRQALKEEARLFLSARDDVGRRLFAEEFDPSVVITSAEIAMGDLRRKRGDRW